jgi:hypothetical protein
MGKFKLWCWVSGIGLFAATMLLYQVHWNRFATQTNTRFESIALANSLATRGTYSDPFAPLATGPSAHVAPGYPALVALLMKMFGAGAGADYALGIVTKAVVGFQLCLLPFLAEYMGLSWIAGALAGGAWLLTGVTLLRWENDFAGLFIVMLAFPMYSSFRRRLSGREVAVVGVLWGVLLLLTPVPVLAFGAWLLCLRLISQYDWKTLFWLAAIPLLVISPWIVRNAAVFHELILVRDNFGLEIGVSNSPCAAFSYVLNDLSGCFGATHPNVSYDEALRVRQLGEASYNHVRLHEGVNWIRNNPDRFLSLTTQRFVAFWFPNPSGNPLQQPRLSRTEWITYLSTLLSIPGLLLMWRSHRAAALLMMLWLVMFPLVYYLTQFSDRYRRPIFWITLLCSSYLLVELLSPLIHRSVQVPSVQTGEDKLRA